MHVAPSQIFEREKKILIRDDWTENRKGFVHSERASCGPDIISEKYDFARLSPLVWVDLDRFDSSAKAFQDG